MELSDININEKESDSWLNFNLYHLSSDNDLNRGKTLIKQEPLSNEEDDSQS